MGEALTAELRQRLEQAGQGHLVQAVARAHGRDRATLMEDVRGLDLELVSQLVDRFVTSTSPDAVAGEISPPTAIPLPRSAAAHARDAAAKAAGEAFLREGRLALVLLAGGQGTRLGFDGPKGDFPYGPVTGRTLFRQHADRVAALRARYGAALPWYILTSPVNDAETRASFAASDYFGLDPASVRFVVQGTLPAVDADTGRVLQESPSRLALSPDGHGGLLTALARAGAWDEMESEGITTFFTFQVDNPLIRVANPVFIGHHLQAQAEMSNLAVRKHDPAERVGVIATIDGATGVVEYSDLPDALAQQREPDGSLRLWAGSIATHLLEVSFARRLTSGGLTLPYHRALKRVPYLTDDGRQIDPEEPNGVKFETFLFDALGQARATLTMEVPRAVDFSPIKNAEGSDSPETCRRDANRLYADWLTQAGVDVPRDADGDPTVDLEIDPRLALDGDELAVRIGPEVRILGDTALGPPA